jgi:hypothetical protein
MYCREEFGRLINLDKGVSSVDVNDALVDTTGDESADPGEEAGLVER